jgi:hypothetical protein
MLPTVQAPPSLNFPFSSNIFDSLQTLPQQRLAPRIEPLENSLTSLLLYAPHGD